MVEHNRPWNMHTHTLIGQSGQLIKASDKRLIKAYTESEASDKRASKEWTNEPRECNHANTSQESKRTQEALIWHTWDEDGNSLKGIPVVMEALQWITKNVKVSEQCKVWMSQSQAIIKRNKRPKAWNYRTGSVGQTWKTSMHKLQNTTKAT